MARRVTACGVVALAVAAPTAPASAADRERTATVTLSGPASVGLSASAVAPARRSGSAVALGWSSESATQIALSGSIRLRRGGRTVTLSKLTYTLGNPRTLRGRVGRKPAATLLRLSGTRATISGELATTTASATLTTGARTALRSALGGRGFSSGRFATVRLIRRATAPEPLPTPVDPGAGNPVSGCARGPALLSRPATAVKVTAATMTWRVRESFIRYINSGQGVGASDGAAKGSPLVIAPSSEPLVYDFIYTFRDGWTDPASGRARLLFTGKVTFKWSVHQIDLALTDPEIEIDGSSSRAVFCTANYANAGETLKRSVLVNLDVSAGLQQMKGTVPSGAAEGTFAGYYFPGDPFGFIGVTGITTAP